MLVLLSAAAAVQQLPNLVLEVVHVGPVLQLQGVQLGAFLHLL